jgi:DNA mismatch repair ATPase MutS
VKSRLLYRERDFDMDRGLAPNQDDLTRDLGLESLFTSMAAEDELVYAASKAVLLSESPDVGTIAYRQGILKDCLKNRVAVRKLYALIIEANRKEKKSFLWFLHMSPSSVLYSALGTIDILLESLESIRNLVRARSADFESEGFSELIRVLETELNDDFFRYVKAHLKELRFGGGTLISAELGDDLKGANYRLRKTAPKGISQRIGHRRNEYQFQIEDRDEIEVRALEGLKDRGLNAVADALSKSKDHILDFLGQMRFELAFYIGCVNLQEKLSSLGMGLAFPAAVGAEERALYIKGLYDPCLALALGRPIVLNDLDADGKDLILITGANQGGKSTFLRSIGLAQLMMQCGMFVAAESCKANVCTALFTHFRRQEDATMKSGKLDEELGRMSALVDRMRENSMILLNESFAATNEREGSEIARQIAAALLDRHIKVAYVTHLYDFAKSMFERQSGKAAFLRAERREDGTRSFKVIAGEPLETSFGIDLYADIFGGE